MTITTESDKQQNSLQESAWNYIGDIYFSSQRFQDADQHYEKALKVIPNNFFFNYRRGCAKHQMRDLNGALDLYARLD